MNSSCVLLQRSNVLEAKKVDGVIASPEGEAAYRRRKVIVEPVFGWIKSVLGFRQFSLRGLRKTNAEWHLVCLAMNLRRMSGGIRFAAA